MRYKRKSRTITPGFSNIEILIRYFTNKILNLHERASVVLQIYEIFLIIFVFKEFFVFLGFKQILIKMDIAIKKLKDEIKRLKSLSGFPRINKRIESYEKAIKYLECKSKENKPSSKVSVCTMYNCTCIGSIYGVTPDSSKCEHLNRQ